MQLLSIITINYNNAVGLKKTMQSVLSQTYKNFEYIIIDGNSTDDSLSIIKQHEKNISYWISEKDKGIYNAMNKGIAKATGTYCMFLNSGDYLFDNDSLANLFKHNFSEDIVCCNLYYRNEKYKVTQLLKYNSQLKFSSFFFGSIGHPSTLIKKQLFNEYGGYDENLKIVADWAFFLKVLFEKKCSFKKVEAAFSVFITDGISSNKNYAAITINERKTILQNNYPHLYDDYVLLDKYLNKSFKGKFLNFKRRLSLLINRKKIQTKSL